MPAHRRAAAPAHRLAAAVGVIVLLTGCGTGAFLTPTSSAGAPTPTSSAPARGPSAEIELDISGGPHSGSYRAVSPQGCDSKPAQNRFTVDYADDSAATDFVALHLVLRDAATAVEDESDDFVAEISLGGPGAGITYAIDPPGGMGSGTALLETSPLDAALDLRAQSPDGAEIDLTVLCEF